MTMPRSPCFSSLTRAVLDQRDDFARRSFGLVAEELGGADLLFQFEPERIGRGLAGAGPGFRASARWRSPWRVANLRVDAEPAPPSRRVLGQGRRKAVSVVELEGDFTRRACRRASAPWSSSSRRSPRSGVSRGSGSSSSFSVSSSQALAPLELVIGAAHLPDQRRHQAIEQRLLGAEDMRMPHGAAHDAAKHIAPALVRRQHAVGDEEGRGAEVVGDDAVARRMLAGGRTPLDRPGRDQRGTDRLRNCRACLAAPRRRSRPMPVAIDASAGRSARRREAARIA
jgi:hypothetical protein